MSLNGKTILITGGCGSFGQKFTEIVLKKYNPKSIRIYDNRELAEVEMERKFNDSRLRFFIGDVRDQKRCFSFIQDDVKVLEKLVFSDKVVGEVINIGPDEEFVTINQLAETIAKLLKFKLKPIYMPERPQEVKLANCSADKARRLLGYKTEYTLGAGLKSMIDYIKKRGPKPFKYHLDLEIINKKTPRTWKDKLF